MPFEEREKVFDQQSFFTSLFVTKFFSTQIFLHEFLLTKISFLAKNYTPPQLCLLTNYFLLSE